MVKIVPGMIGVNKKGRFDFMGTADTVLQGDTDAAHVWWVLPNGKIASTGAKFGLFYGEYDPKEYLKGKEFYLLQSVDPIPGGKLAIMQACHAQLMQSGIKRLYGLWKFPYIWGLAILNGAVDKTGKQAKTSVPEFPICSQAVAYPFWRAGIPLGAAQGKEDWTAVLPETILKEGNEVLYHYSYYLNGPHPCYFMRNLQAKPFTYSDIEF